MKQQLATSAFVGLLAASLALWGWLLTRWFRQSAAERGPWLPRHAGCPPEALILGFSIWILIPPIVVSLVMGDSTEPLRKVQANVASQLAIVACLMLALNRYREPARSWWRGLDREETPAPVRIQLQLAWQGVQAFVLAVLPVYVLMWSLSGLRTRQSQHPFLQMMGEDGRTQVVLWVFVSAAVLAPLAEELVFRVILQGGLQRHLPVLTVTWSVAIFFCAVHVTSVARIPDGIALFPLALILGVLYQQTRSYVAIVTAHVCFNLTNLLFSLALPRS